MHNFNRRQLLSLAAGGTAAAVLSLAGCRSASVGGKSPAKRPNIIFIMADDLGYGDLGCFDQMALNVDIAPTILELARLRVPQQMQGRSLLPLLKGRKPKWRTEFFYEHPFVHKTIARTEALRTQRWKYARYIDYDYEELYDLENDPAESINLAKDEKYQKTLASLQKRCNDLAKKAEGT